MRLPRFLWVPFDLGRPFGAPGAPDFQRRVLRAALELLESGEGPVVLEDFPEDAPEGDGSDGASWVCPVTFPPVTGANSDLVARTLEEISRLAPWVEVGGTDADPVSGVVLAEIPARLGGIVDGTTTMEAAADVSPVEWVRLACDDLRNWYLDAARNQPGRASATELRDWFWLQTAAAQLIAATATALLEHPEPMVKLLALRVMVPREYLDRLAPEIAAAGGAG